VAYLRRLNNESDAINKEITEMVIYSTGAVSFNDAWEMSLPQRQLVVKTLEGYYKAKAGKPVNEDM
tara:strand:- start:3691 stop:3888 length:198 start_codon:yes stop_codon:yes gene_type:complete